jgi:hypothetical protein
METIDIKKEKVKKILASIEQSALSLIDTGNTLHPMDLVMELTITAYELDILTDFVNRHKGDNKEDTVGASKANKKIIKLKPKEKQ